jgi:hypothetical protein
MKKIYYLIYALFVELHAMAQVKINNLTSGYKNNFQSPGGIKSTKASFALFRLVILAFSIIFVVEAAAQIEKAPFLPSQIELDRPFGQYDKLSFFRSAEIVPSCYLVPFYWR